MRIGQTRAELFAAMDERKKEYEMTTAGNILADVQPGEENETVRRLRQELNASEQLRYRAEGAMRLLLGLAGDIAECKGCGATVYFVKHRTKNKDGSNKTGIYNPDGISHYATCPKSGDYKVRQRSLTDADAR